MPHPHHPYARRPVEEEVQEETKPIRAVIPRKPKGQTLAQMIRAKRGERTLRELAAEVDIPFQTWFKLEKGQMPRPRTFLKLLWWLDVIDDTTAERLMDYDNEGETHGKEKR